MTSGPPRLVRLLLERVIPDGASGPSVLGDLHEEYQAVRRERGRSVADLWYVGQAVVLAVPWSLLALWTGVRRIAREGTLGLGLDIRHTLRGLAKSPSTVVVAVASLGLGIALSVTAAGVVGALWFPALPYPSAERLMELDDAHPVEVCPGCSPGTSWASYLEWRDELSVFDAMAAALDARVTMEAGESRTEIRATAVSGGYPALLGIGAACGRMLAPEDDRPGAPRVLVLGHRIWTSRFGSDPAVVGRTVRLDGRPYEVVGVMRSDARPLGFGDAWVSLTPWIGIPSEGRDQRVLRVLARRAEGVDATLADSRLSAYAARRYADLPSLDAGWSARARSLRAVLRNDVAPPVAGAALMGTALMVLLIASLNLASLLLARVTDRTGELGLRAALGSGRCRLARAAALEAVLLSAAGGVAGTGLGWWAMGAIAQRNAGQVPGWMAYEVDERIVAVAAILTVATAVACAAFPLQGAWRLRPGHVLGRAPGLTSRRRQRRHDLLLAAQVAVGILLVAGAARAVQTFIRVSDLDTLGHRWEGLMTVSVTVPARGRDDTGDRGVLADALRERFRRTDGVARVAASAPLFLGSWGAPDAPSPVRAEGAPEPVPNHRVPRHSLAVTPGWLELMEIPVRAGRSFTEGDGEGAPRVAVVSERAAAVLWPEAEPRQAVGRNVMIRIDGQERAFAVVGVAGDVVIDPRREDRAVSPRIYLSLRQTPEALMPGSRGAEVLLEAPATLPASTWARATAEVDPEATVTYAQPLARTLGDWNVSIRRTAGSLSGVGALALGILLLGVYGTMSYRVASIRYELGVRVALGARPPELVRAAVARVGWVFAGALTLGIVLSVVGARVFDGVAIPVGTSDAGMLAVSALLLVLAGGAGCLAPLRRALAVDPLACLRGG